MPSVTNKAYDSILEAIAKLSEGVTKHTENTRVMRNLDSSLLNKEKEHLIELRENYLHLENEARRAYERFKANFDLTQKQLSNNHRIIKGIFGPKANELWDFGITPERSKAKVKLPMRRIADSEEPAGE